MKKLIIAACFAFCTGTAFAQSRPTTPGTGTPGTMPTQTPPATGTSPGTNTMQNNGNNPYNGTSPNAYPGATTPYPGTNTTTQPGPSTPGTGTAPRPGTTTPGVRTYSDKNNLIDNNPNPSTPANNPAVGNPMLNGR